MTIGNNKINGICSLAPMAGVTDRAFRELCLEMGASFTVTEMVSANALFCNSKKTDFLMSITEKEKPCIIQIFGHDVDMMVYAAKAAEQKGCIGIDINMGCPAPKVSNNGSGAALMKNESLAFRITEECVKAVEIPVSVKFRTGWDENNLNCVQFARGLENAGAAFLTVHGRTKKQMYAPPVNYEMIKNVKEAVKIPVIGNGDVCDIPSAEKMLVDTGCDFLMTGRGAMGNPWLFGQLNSYFCSGKIIAEPSPEEKMAVMLRHIEKLCEYKGLYTGIREARKHAGWYTKGMRGSALLRRDIGAIESLDDLRKIAERIIEENM